MRKVDSLQKQDWVAEKVLLVSKSTCRSIWVVEEDSVISLLENPSVRPSTDAAHSDLVVEDHHDAERNRHHANFQPKTFQIFSYSI